MKIFRMLLAIMWVAVLVATIRAISADGLTEAGSTFLGDLDEGWRGQFTTDFSGYLLLGAAWIAWREEHLGLRITGALLAVVLGGLFLLAYILRATWVGEQTVSSTFLGRHLSPARSA